MNTELNNIVRVAQGRYLNEQEADTFLEYARGLGERIEHTRELEQKELHIAQTAATALFERFSSLTDVPQARQKVERDFRYHLRYAAAAHVNDDMPWFLEHYGDWISELLTSMRDAQVVMSGYESLLQTMAEELEPACYRVFEPYTRQFIGLLEKYV